MVMKVALATNSEPVPGIFSRQSEPFVLGSRVAV